MLKKRKASVFWVMIPLSRWFISESAEVMNSDSFLGFVLSCGYIKYSYPWPLSIQMWATSHRGQAEKQND